MSQIRLLANYYKNLLGDEPEQPTSLTQEEGLRPANTIPDTVMMGGVGLLKDAAMEGGRAAFSGLRGMGESGQLGSLAAKAAEREAFKNEFDPGWFHATKVKDNFEQFNPDLDTFKPSNSYPHGRATYFTKDPKFSENFLDDGSLTDTFAKNSRIIPVNIRNKNVFDYENPEHLRILDENFPSILKNYNNEFSDGITAQNLLKNGDWETLENPKIKNAIARSGFDGMYVKEAGNKNLGMFNPKNDVRVPWAKFDPESKTGGLLSGIGGAAILGKELSDNTDMQQYAYGGTVDFNKLRKHLRK